MANDEMPFRISAFQLGARFRSSPQLFLVENPGAEVWNPGNEGFQGRDPFSEIVRGLTC